MYATEKDISDLETKCSFHKHMKAETATEDIQD